MCRFRHFGPPGMSHRLRSGDGRPAGPLAHARGPGRGAGGAGVRVRARPFRAGWHRGADFAAAPGVAVRAACSGRVAWAGRDVVTVRCGGYRVTHLPLASVAVARGARVRAGTPDRDAGPLARPRRACTSACAGRATGSATWTPCRCSPGRRAGYRRRRESGGRGPRRRRALRAAARARAAPRRGGPAPRRPAPRRLRPRFESWRRGRRGSGSRFCSRARWAGACGSACGGGARRPRCSPAANVRRRRWPTTSPRRSSTSTPRPTSGTRTRRSAPTSSPATSASAARRCSSSPAPTSTASRWHRRPSARASRRRSSPTATPSASRR